MENHSNRTDSRTNHHFGDKTRQIMKIVELPMSNCPRLLRWLRHFRFMIPVNNTHYNPTLPTAS